MYNMYLNKGKILSMREFSRLNWLEGKVLSGNITASAFFFQVPFLSRMESMPPQSFEWLI